MRKNIIWLLVTCAVMAIDRVSKALVLEHLFYGQPVSITPFLNFTLAENSGAAFSFLANASGWQTWLFCATAIIASIFILRWLLKLSPKQVSTAWALSLILGGAISNLLDRLFYGRVVDFVDFHIKTWHFATFNIADSAISTGIVILILFWNDWKEKKRSS